MVNTTPWTHLKLIYNNIGLGEGGYGDFSNILGGKKKFVCIQTNFGNDCRSGPRANYQPTHEILEFVAILL